MWQTSRQPTPYLTDALMHKRFDRLSWRDIFRGKPMPDDDGTQPFGSNREPKRDGPWLDFDPSDPDWRSEMDAKYGTPKSRFNTDLNRWIVND